MSRRRDPGWIRRWWPIFTVLLALLVVVGFGGPETVAVVDPGSGGSYTESLRQWLGTEDGGTSPIFWTVTGVLVAAGLTVGVWLPVHLVRGWPWEKRRPRAR